MSTCYLNANVEGDRIAVVFTCSEPPWSMTQYGSHEVVLLYQATGESYSEAREELRAVYPMLFPRLSKRLPFPGGES